MIASPHISDTSSRPPSASERTPASDSPVPGQPVHSPAPGADRFSHWPRNGAHLLVNVLADTHGSLAEHAAALKVPYETLNAAAHSPAFVAEALALRNLSDLRIELIACATRPLAIQKLVAIIESPLPTPTGRDPEADARAFCRAADLSLRAINALFRHSRQPSPRRDTERGAPSAPPQGSSGSSSISTSSPSSTHSSPPRSSDSSAPSAFSSPSTSSSRTANVSERISNSASSSPSASSNLGAADFSPRGSAASPPTSPVPPAPISPSSTSSSPPRSSDSSAPSAFSSPSRSVSSPPSPSSQRSSALSADSVVPSLKDVADSPAHALRAAAGSTRPVRDPSHRARDRPAP